MKNRASKRRDQVTVQPVSVRFETLEPRNMLAADLGIADPFSSSLLTHVGNDTPATQQVDVLRNHLQCTVIGARARMRHMRFNDCIMLSVTHVPVQAKLP